MGAITLVPIEPGSATCDANWRFRLPTNYAKYLLSQTPGTDTASIYIATLDAQEMLLWSRQEFLSWRDHLQLEPASNEELLDALQYFGGETEIDNKGRFVLPKNVRDVLKGVKPGNDFKIIGGAPLRLLTAARYEEKRRRVKPGPELRKRARAEYSRFTKAKQQPA